MLRHFSHVQLFVTLWTIARQAPLSMKILQSRILEWVAMPSSRVSSLLRDWTQVSYVSCIGRQVLYHWHHLGSPRQLLRLVFITNYDDGEGIRGSSKYLHFICPYIYAEYFANKGLSGQGYGFFQWSCMDVRVRLSRKLSTVKVMLLNYGVGEDSWESLGLQGDPTSPS